MYNTVTFRKIPSNNSIKTLSLLIILALSVSIAWGIVSCFHLDVNKIEYFIIILGIFSSILFIKYNEKLFFVIYKVFTNKILLLQPFLEDNENKIKRYISIPHFSNHAYWIDKYIRDNNFTYRASICIFPTSPSYTLDKEDNRLTDDEEKLYSLYTVFYNFSNPEKKLLFFISTFFIYIFLYFLFIFMSIIFYFYLIQYIGGISYIVKISFFVLFLVISFAFLMYKYVSLFHLPFIDKDIQELSNEIELSKQFSIYYYDRYLTQRSNISPSQIVQSIHTLKQELMNTISAILQISIPILFLSMISISIALFNNYEKKIHTIKPKERTANECCFKPIQEPSKR